MVHSPMANEESFISFSFTQVTFGHRDARAIEKHKDKLDCPFGYCTGVRYIVRPTDDQLTEAMSSGKSYKMRKGPSIYYVRKILGFFDPPCPHLGLIYSTKFTQPPLLNLLLG